MNFSPDSCSQSCFPTPSIDRTGSGVSLIDSRSYLYYFNNRHNTASFLYVLYKIIERESTCLKAAASRIGTSRPAQFAILNVCSTFFRCAWGAPATLPEFSHMSGHSKWATIKHKKAALDAKRGKTFTRLIKEITIAARNGGDPDGNPRLRTAILAAKNVSMPADNIKKAIMRGTGELEGGQIDEVTFEGYGPGGAAVLVAVATDNRNRTVSEIRHMFSKNGGNLGEQGSVAWMFERKSQIVIEKENATEDQLMDLVLEAGADDLRDNGDVWEIISDPASHEAVVEALQKAKIETVSATVGMIPKNLMKLEGKNAQAMLRLTEALEEHDDVQDVYSNFDVDEKEVEALA